MWSRVGAAAEADVEVTFFAPLDGEPYARRAMATVVTGPGKTPPFTYKVIGEDGCDVDDALFSVSFESSGNRHAFEVCRV